MTLAITTAIGGNINSIDNKSAFPQSKHFESVYLVPLPKPEV